MTEAATFPTPAPFSNCLLPRAQTLQLHQGDVGSSGPAELLGNTSRGLLM